MSIHTLIPEAHSYGIAILVIFGLCSFSLALHIHSRTLAGKKISFWVIQNGILTFTVAWGLLIFNVVQIVGSSLTAWIISIPVGIVAGWLAGWSDRTIIRYLSYRHLALRNGSMPSRRIGIRQTQNEWNISVRSNHAPIVTHLAKKRTISLHKGQQSFQPSLEYQQFGLWSVVIVAVLEELIYRGFLVKVCFLFPNSLLTGIALVGIVLVFAFGHIQFGWSHVLAKLPLSVLTMIAVIALGTVLPAVIAHVLFNFGVWKDKSSQPVFLGTHEQSQRIIY